ncbi:cyclin-dependent kinase inhibitor 3 [Patella vulgata]|uniref:cyclin-dependent kinase inhibitor 3 n=1 Tax=Patella vulgata TaxID=6465 RepID=UPI00217FCE8D|nr:cyclin-dependent kinase inhibitor 3 [Patella vulgata]
MSSASGFNSSDDEGEVDLTPFKTAWLDLQLEGCTEKLGISALPGCRYKDIWRSVTNDLKCMKEEGIKEVFCLCTKGELHKYRVTSLLQDYSTFDVNVHHYPFPDGQTASLPNLIKMLEELKINILNGKKSLVHCYGGLGRSCLVAACLMMYLDETIKAEEAIKRVRDLQGTPAIQSVKQFNFVNDFRQMLQDYQQTEGSEQRSVSR